MIKCDKCSAPAVVNYQKVWAKYPIASNGEYQVAEIMYEWNASYQPEDNVYLCAEHEMAGWRKQVTKPIHKIDIHYCPFVNAAAPGFYCEMVHYMGRIPWGDEPCTLNDWHKCPYNQSKR